MHRIVEERYLENPDDVVRFGLENLKRWKQRVVECDDFRIWEEILRKVPQRIPEILGGLGEKAVRPRQSSPFGDFVREESRQQILTTSL